MPRQCPPLDLSGGGALPPLANENKKNISKDMMKIKENLKTCALKKVYIKKEHGKIYFFYPYVDENIFLRDLFRIKCHWEDDILLK